MRLPKQIDHRLIDTIIQVRFVSAVPREAVVGYVHRLWQDQSVGMRTGPMPGMRVGLPNLMIESAATFYFLTTDNRFRVDVEGTSITFNSIGDYAGWAAFRQTFERCMEPLFTQHVISHPERLGIRYINRFDNIRILDHIDADIRVGGVVPPGSRRQIRVEFDRNEFFSVLTIVNDYPASAVETAQPDPAFFSLADVDVIKNFDPRQPVTYPGLLSTLEKAHTEEKTIFFSLLTPEFLASLNPVY